MVALSIGDADHQRIADAIRAAEASTSGEIYCVVARASGSHFFAAAAIASVSILLGSLMAAFVLEAWWVTVRLPVFIGAQLLAFATAIALLYAVPGLRLRLTPRAWTSAACHDNALRQFLARNVHRTARRTGVLIFVSVAERHAEIVADSGIDAKVAQQEWDGIVAGLIAQARKGDLAAGFLAAIASVGALLSVHFPSRGPDRNELDDHLVEI